MGERLDRNEENCCSCAGKEREEGEKLGAVPRPYSNSSSDRKVKPCR